jgi:UDP-N-acetylglucosamine 2-epimerase (non-hydrolysing)
VQLRVVHVVGARPNFMKVAPVMRALSARGAEQVLVHTGQHYDPQMSKVFFRDLGLPKPDIHLEVGSAPHGEQTGRVMITFERALRELPRPDWVLVPGDVNSTVAAALVAVKLEIPVAHLEAGLRSFDRTMPEEHNRVVADHLAERLLTPSADADENLRREGIPASRVARVGNVMIDTLHHHLPAAEALGMPRTMEVRPRGYALVTLHRPANVDAPEVLARLFTALARVAQRMPVLFPVHPRTRVRLQGLEVPGGLRLCAPLGYLECLSLSSAAAVILTDSGGLQEEATALGVPCLTLRDNTERPITVTEGTNTVVGTDPDRILAEVDQVLAGRGKVGRRPELWDGKAGERVADALAAGAVRQGPSPEVA